MQLDLFAFLALQVIDDMLDVLRPGLVCDKNRVFGLHDDDALQPDSRDQKILGLDEGVATVIRYNVAQESPP